MLHIKDIGRNSVQLQNSPLSNSKLWLKTTDNVFPTDLSVYLARSKQEGRYDSALLEIEELQRLTILELLKGRLNDAPYLSFTARKQVRLTYGDFATFLHFSGLKNDRQMAILFALESGLKPEDVVTLTWQTYKKMPTTPVMRAITDSFPRSLNVNYVFWERFEDFGMVGPMFGLSQDFADLFQDLQYKEVWRLFHEAAAYITYDDAADFESVMGELHGARW